MKQRQSASVRDAKKYLAQAIAAGIEAKKIISFVTREGRLLLDDKEFHQLQDLALIAGAQFSVIESHLSRYSRMSVGSNRFAVIQK